MFKLIAPSAALIAISMLVFSAPRLIRAALAGKLTLRRAKPERTWALFVDWRSTGRKAERYAMVIRAADPASEVIIYRRKDRPDLCRKLGVTEAPTLVLGDGGGGARIRLAGHDTIETWLDRRFEPI